jgi:hypothetical protein
MSAHCSAYTLPDTGEPSKQLVGIERRAQAAFAGWLDQLSSRAFDTHVIGP